MNVALAVTVIGAVLYLIFSFVERGEPGKELARIAFAMGLLAYLLLVTR
jgi:hypothetical protein